MRTQRSHRCWDPPNSEVVDLSNDHQRRRRARVASAVLSAPVDHQVRPWAQNIFTGLTTETLGAFMYLWTEHELPDRLPITGVAQVKGNMVTNSGRLRGFASYSLFSGAGAVSIGTTTSRAGLDASYFATATGRPRSVRQHPHPSGCNLLGARPRPSTPHVLPADTPHELPAHRPIAVRHSAVTATRAATVACRLRDPSMSLVCTLSTASLLPLNYLPIWEILGAEVRLPTATWTPGIDTSLVSGARTGILLGSQLQGGPAAMNVTNRMRTTPRSSVTTGGRQRGRRRRLSAWGAVGTALLGAGPLAACGSGAHPSSPTKVVSGALAYANCMRAHGVPDFPDPNGQGEFQLRPVKVENGRTTKAEDLLPSSPAFQAAERVCGRFGSAGRQVTATQEKQEFQKSLQAAACMRANGVPNYPDPTLIDGTIDHNFNPSLNINPSSPAFLQAAKKCAHGQPGRVGPG
jgi:hypothetical protein